MNTNKRAVVFALVLALLLVLVACGGSDDVSIADSTSPSASAPTSIPGSAGTVTPAPTPDEPEREVMGRTSNDEYQYEMYSDGTATLLKYLGSESAVTVPGSIDNYKVTALGDETFYNNNNLISVIIFLNFTAEFYESKKIS